MEATAMTGCSCATTASASRTGGSATWQTIAETEATKSVADTRLLRRPQLPPCRS